MLTHIELRRIDLWSLFKVAFLLYFAIGLVVGLFYGLFVIAASTFGTAFLDEDLPTFGVLGGALSLLAIPIVAVFYGGFGGVIVTLVGVVYNIAAGFMGGIRFETRIDEPAATPSQPAPSEPRPASDGHEDLKPPDIDLT